MADEAGAAGAVAVVAVGDRRPAYRGERSEVLAAVEERSGVRIEVISGEEEARLAYLATRAALGWAPVRSSCSTPAAAARSSRSATASGYTSGSASTSARRASPSGTGSRAPFPSRPLAAARMAIAAELRPLARRPAPDLVVGMGGAVTNLAAVKHALAAVRRRHRARHGARPRRDRAADRALPHRAADERRQIVGLQPNRAEVILAGACIVADDPRVARPRRADGERPRPAPRPARRAIRSGTLRRREPSTAGARMSTADGAERPGRLGLLLAMAMFGARGRPRR